MKLIDRLLVRGYVKSYAVCLVSLLSLFIVVDLFTNLDNFDLDQKGLLPLLKRIVVFYTYKSADIFDKLSEPVALLAAMFTVAWMQRHNELIPLLSAGVSTHRVVLPVLLTATAMLGLSTVNTELVIPRIATALLSDRDDPDGEKTILVHGAYEPHGTHAILIEGKTARRKDRVVEGFHVTIPEGVANNLVNLDAKWAYYIPPGEGPRTGGWLLTGTEPPELEGWENPILELLDPGKYFLRTTVVDFDAITRSRTWFQYASTNRLRQELSRPDSTRLAAMAVLFHMRLTRPLLGLLLVVLGLAVILRDQNRNVFLSAGLCLVLCALFFAASFACRHLGNNEYLAPALAAWLPVLLFGPAAMVLYDAVHT